MQPCCVIRSSNCAVWINKNAVAKPTVCNSIFLILVYDISLRYRQFAAITLIAFQQITGSVF